jgi:hypothetical protein
MSDEPMNLTPGERELQEGLSHLSPAHPEKTETIAIAFDAGRRGARRSLTAWRSAAAVLLVALTANVLIRVERPAGSNPQPSASIAVAPPNPADAQLATYYAIRNDVINHGVAALPDARATAGEVPTRIRSAGDFDKL